MKLIDIVTGPWAIQPEKLLEIQAIYATHLRGDKIDLEAVEKRIGRPLGSEPKGYNLIDGVAVLPVNGVLGKRANLLTQVSGMASTEIIGNDFKTDRLVPDHGAGFTRPCFVIHHAEFPQDARIGCVT